MRRVYCVRYLLHAEIDCETSTCYTASCGSPRARRAPPVDPFEQHRQLRARQRTLCRSSPAATRSGRAPGASQTGTAHRRPTTASSPDRRAGRGTRTAGRRTDPRASCVCTSAAKPSKPLRMSVTPAGQPHPHARRQRDHRRTQRFDQHCHSAPRSTRPCTRMRSPPANSISMQPAPATALAECRLIGCGVACARELCGALSLIGSSALDAARPAPQAILAGITAASRTASWH